MASYEPAVNVTISLDTTVISRAGFGTPLFIGAGQWFTDRIRTYTSTTAAAIDLPTSSDEYKAVEAAFKQTPRITTVKVGRRDASLVTLTPSPATVVGQVFSVTVKGTGGVDVAATFTSSTGSETAAAIATALAAGLSGLVGVTVVDTTGAVTLAKSGSAPYAIVAITDSLITAVSTASESAAATVAAIEVQDDNFYFVAAYDKTEAYVLAMAATIESRNKVYFVSIASADSLTAYTGAAVSGDVLGKLREGAFLRTVGWFHQTAATGFPEMGYIAIGASADAGKSVWANNQTNGVTAAQDPATGFNLTTTQKGYLTARNASFGEVRAGVTVSSAQSGKTASGEWVDVIRNRDFLVARITEAYQSFFIATPVIPFTDSGINRVKSVLSTELSRYVETETEPNILESGEPYTLNFPTASQITAADKANRLFTANFDAYLAGAIQITKITGSLTYRLGQ